MKLHYEKIGSGHPLVILHGLYGSGKNWLSIARELSGICEVYLVDQRNHGDSPHASQHAYPDMMDDLKELLDDLNLHKAMLLGHSMGGKTAMYFATHYPGRVSRLMVADMSPLSYLRQDETPEQVHGHMHIMNSMLNLDLKMLNSLKEIDQALAISLPDKRLRQFLFKNLRKNEVGYSWGLNLTGLLDSLQLLVEGLPREIIEQGGYKQYPVLFIKGENSSYIQDADEEVIKHVFPGAAITTIRNAGHWLHAEQPDIFVKIVKKFLLEY